MQWIVSIDEGRHSVWTLDLAHDKNELVLGLDGGGVVIYWLCMDTIRLIQAGHTHGRPCYKEVARFGNLGTCSSVVHDKRSRWYAGCNDGVVYSGKKSVCDSSLQIVDAPVVEDGDFYRVEHWDIYSLVCV